MPVLKGPSPANNPYIHHSNLPEGTVFIGVGSGLALLVLLTFAWRGLVAWSLHRSVSKAATSANSSYVDTKPHAKSAPGAFYAAGPGSTLSLGDMASPTRHTPNSSLFFSPTSNSAVQQPVVGAGARQSTYLPGAPAFTDPLWPALA